MTFPFVFWILITTSLIGILLLVYRKPYQSIQRRFSMFPRTILALITWILPYAIEIGHTDPEVMILMANLQFFGIGSVPFLLYLTTRQFVGRPLRHPSLAIFVAIIPLITVILAFTDPWHGLFRESVEVVRSSGMTQLDVVYGAWHNFVFVPYQYFFYFAALYLLLRAAVTAPQIFRMRMILFSLGIIVPMIGGAMYVLGIPPFEVLNPVSLLIMVSFVSYGIILIRSTRTDIVPVAKDLVLNTLEEVVILLDQNDRVVDFNIAASSTFWELIPSALGKDLADVLGRYDALVMVARGVEQTDAGFVLNLSGEERHYLAQGSPLIGFDGTRIGRVLTATDISGRNAAVVPSLSPSVTDEIVESDNHGIPLARKTFFLEAARELSRSQKHGHSMFVLVVLVTENGPDTDVGMILDILSRNLESWERTCYYGNGQYLILIPESFRESVLLRARDLSRKLIWKKVQARFGIATNATESAESIQEIVARAIVAAKDSHKSISIAN